MPRRACRVAAYASMARIRPIICLAPRRPSSTYTGKDQIQRVSFKDMAYGNPLGLPRLPIPAIEDTVSRYLESVEPLARDSPEDLARVRAVADRFLQGDGPKLHQAVVDRDLARKGHPHSYIEKLWDDMYLKGRWSLPINSNPYIAVQPPPENAAVSPGDDPQIIGATRFISSFLKWHRRVRDGTFEPDAGCVHGYALQGGTARIARKGRDEVEFHPASRHAAVFCNNRVFRLNLLGGDDGGVQVSNSDLRKSLEKIRSLAFSEPDVSHAGGLFVGHLTTQGRDQWGGSRAVLEASSDVNKATLSEIDSALLSIALEDEETPNMKGEARAFFTGDNGQNRWFDKHQLVVLKNGAMAVNFEHSFSDGMAWVRMLGEIWHDMYGVESKGVRPFPKAPLLSSPPPPPRELKWTLPDELKGELLRAKKAFDEACEGYTLEYVEFQDFGKEACKQWKVSPDAVAQMAYQLAYRRLHGAMPPTYESCSTRAFHHGRTEVIRSCTTEAADFAAAMDSDAKGKDTRRAALDRAAAKHVKIAKAAAQGQGVDRHVLAMSAAASDLAGSGAGGPMPGSEFFEDPLASESSTWRLSTSNLSMPFISSFGFGPVTGDGYGLGYTILDDRITVPVSAFRGGKTDGELLAKEAVRALRDIGDVCR